jgi:hypothetical protein
MHRLGTGITRHLIEPKDFTFVGLPTQNTIHPPRCFSQKISNWSLFYKSRSLITVFTKTRYFSVHWDSSAHCTSSQPAYLTFLARLSPLGTAVTTGLLYQPQMIVDGECGAVGGMKIGKRNQSTLRKPTPAPLFPPEIPLGQTRDRTRAAAVKPATNHLSYGAACFSNIGLRFCFIPHVHNHILNYQPRHVW